VLLTDSLSYAFVDEIATGFLGAVARELEVTGIAMTLLSSPRGSGLTPARDVVLDGAIVYSVDGDSPAIQWLRRRDMPLVYVDQVDEPGIPSINIDDRVAARAAAQHLVELGHRDIGIVMQGMDAPIETVYAPDTSSAHLVPRERMKGWLDALEPAGARIRAVNEAVNGEPEGQRAAALLLDQPDRPTALLAQSDLMAAGALRAAEERGIDVPRQLSLVGFDDSPLAARLRPTLTTVRQPTAEKGRLAAETLMTAIERAQEGTTPSRARHQVLETELVVRDSTARPAR
jgi:DNA-binding LacI/PurR family transcriptional regulator